MIRHQSVILMRWLFPLVIGFAIGSAMGYVMGYSHLGAEVRGEREPTLVTELLARPHR